MKTLITCASLAAVGAVSSQAQNSDPAADKPWNVGAKIRGFYDDNYAGAPDNPSFSTIPGPKESWGVDIAPWASYTFLRDLTTASVRYDFDARWYEARPENEWDLTHQLNITAAHSFSERFKVELTDSFVKAQEPEILAAPGAQFSSFVRTDGDNYRNYGGIGFLANWSEKWGTRIGYQNTIYDYEEDGPASRSALLDRMEHLGTIDLRYKLCPPTTALVGYSFGYSEQNSTDPLSFAFNSPFPKVRNQRSHYGFVGVEHQFNPQFSVDVRLGAQYADFYNANDDFLVPYADAALVYHHTEDTTFSIGVKHGINQTDVAVTQNLNPVSVLAVESTTVYGIISHRFTQKISTAVRGQWQGAAFLGSQVDGQSDNYYSVDVTLSYQLNTHLAADVGYVFDKLDSDLRDRGFDRNRFFFGITASY